ncbi:Cell division protein kinase 4, partial [Atta colombica]
ELPDVVDVRLKIDASGFSLTHTAITRNVCHDDLQINKKLKCISMRSQDYFNQNIIFVIKDLASYIANYRNSSPRSSIPPYLVRQMLKEILCGVEFLHSHRIIHRDLKPQNLLVTREGRIKIADFGLAKTYGFEMRLTSVVVTQWYRAPEVLLGCSYATPVDVWSVGCILAELCKLEPLFPGTSEGDQLDRIFQVLGTPSQEEWPENVSLNWNAFPYRHPRPLSLIVPDLNEDGLDLIKNMLMFDPHSRITAAQAVRHRYFSEEDVQ